MAVNVYHTTSGRRLAVKKNENTGAYAGLQLGIVSHEDESAAFDRLGPRTRQAINDTAIKTLAHPIWKQIVDKGYDPLHPGVDEVVAAQVFENSRKKIALDRDQVDADLAVVPLRAVRRRAARRL